MIESLSEHVVAVGVVLVRRVDVDELGGEVGVERARGDPEVDDGAAGHLDSFGERLRLVDEHVRPLGEPRVRLARGEELRRLLLVCRARGHDVAEAQHRAEEPRPRRLHRRALRRQLADRAVEAADRRHGMRRVVGVAQRLGRRRPAPRARASRRRAGRGVVSTARASGHSCSSRQRPPWSSLPSAVRPAGAAAHDEDPDRRLVLPAVPLVLQPAVEERELLLEVALDAPDRVRPEVDVERPGRVAAHADVAPRADDEPLRRLVLRRHRREVLAVGVREGVEPAGRVRARDVGVARRSAR